MCSATLPAEGGVYAGGAARRDVQLPLAAILAAATAAADGGGDASLQVWIGGRAPTTTTAHYDG